MEPTIRERVGYAIAGHNGNGNGHLVSEMIGRYVYGQSQMNVFKSKARVKTYDETIGDYEFYDRLRRGKAYGYNLGGLFSRRIETIFAAWTLGLGFDVKLKEGAAAPDNEADPKNYTDKLLAAFKDSLLEAPEDMSDDMDRDTGVLFKAYKNSMGLGDQYFIVNPDGSITCPSPDTVTRIHSDLDHREVLGYTIENRTGKYTITETYTAYGRGIEVKEGTEVIRSEMYENLIGRIPVVHVPNEREPNETHGHSVHEALLPLYDNYDDVLYKQLDGAKLLGNPLLTFVGMEDINAVINANDPGTQDTYTDKDGATDTRYQLNIDQNAVLLVGKGGDAKMVGPVVGFSADTQQSLKTLFLLLLDRTGIPEFIWGNEVSSGRSSSETQLEQWLKDIQARQRDASGWLLKLFTIWLQMKALTDPRIVMDTLKVSWPQLVADDKETLLKVVQFAKDRGLLTARTALDLLTLVDNPGIETANAATEMEEQRQKLYEDEYAGRINTDINYQDDNPDGSNV